jgi:hypothetical protein
MTWVKTYEAFMYEGKSSNTEVSKLEKLLSLPLNTGIFDSVVYDKSTATLSIEQPNDLNPMDAGAVLAAINKDKQKIKSTYAGIKKIAIGDLQITI